MNTPAATPRKIKRHEKVIRQWWILLKLDSHARGLTVSELTNGLEDDRKVSRRTIHRDIDALELAGFPINVSTIAEKGGRPELLVTLDRSNWSGGSRVLFADPAVGAN